MLHGVREPLCALGKLMANTRWSVAIRNRRLGIRQYARCRSVGAAFAASWRARAASVARQIDDMDAKKKIVTMSKPGRSHRAEDWPWARDSISHVSPARPNAQNANSANGAHSEPRVLARHRDDQTESLISRRSTPMASLARVALSGPVGLCWASPTRSLNLLSARTQRRGETPSSSGPLSVSASASSTSSRRREDRRERARGLPACSRRAVLERLRDVVFVSARDGA